MPPFRALRIASISLSLCAAPRIAETQSIGASLPDYGATLRVSSVAGVPAKSFSGVAFHPETRTLYVIDNDNAVVYELDTSGTLLRSISTSGFLDPEGIAYQSNDYFLIAEEGLANIVRVKLPRSGGGPVARSGGTALNIAQNLANSGIEGVSYCPANRTAYAVKEASPSRLYRIALDSGGNPSAAFPGEPFSIEGKSGDAADIHALDDGGFIVVNQEQDKLEGYGPQGQPLSSLALGMGKPEGITMDTRSGTIYVVGEPLELGVFKKRNTGARNPAPADAGFSCAAISGKTPGAAPTLRFSLPYRTSVHIDFTDARGAWKAVFAGTMNQGIHRYDLGRAIPGPGIGFYRFSAGPLKRVVTMVSP